MKKRSMVKVLGAAGLLLVLAVGAVYAFNLPGLGKYKEVTPKNGSVSISLDKISDGEAHFFIYNDGGKEIKFFAVKAKSGSIKTAFDACDVCYEDKKGYRQEGDVMVCNQCNKKFATDRIGPSSTGGCNPSYLPNQVSGSTIVIKADDIKKGARFF